jgi:hypothetical protein
MNTNKNVYNYSLFKNIIITLIVISIIGFLIGLYNYVKIKLEDPYINKNGGGEIIGKIITTPDVTNYSESYYNKKIGGINSITKYNFKFKVSYNINNKTFEKELNASNILDPNTPLYRLNNKIDLLYDKNNDIIIKTTKYDESYINMINNFISIFLMKISLIFFIIFTMIYIYFFKKN